MVSKKTMLALLLGPSLAFPSMALVARGGFMVDGTDTRERVLSWQMYSLVPGEPAYVVELDDGSTRHVDIEPLTSAWDRRMHYGTELPERICERVAGAVRVVRSSARPEQRISYTC